MKAITSFVASAPPIANSNVTVFTDLLVKALENADTKMIAVRDSGNDVAKQEKLAAFSGNK